MSLDRILYSKTGEVKCLENDELRLKEKHKIIKLLTK